MGAFVKTATGKRFEADNCRASQFGDYNVMFIDLIGYQIIDVAMTFCNKNETRQITFTNEDGEETVHNGFTDIVGIDMMGDRRSLKITLTDRQFE